MPTALATALLVAVATEPVAFAAEDRGERNGPGDAAVTALGTFLGTGTNPTPVSSGADTDTDTDTDTDSDSDSSDTDSDSSDADSDADSGDDSGDSDADSGDSEADSGDDSGDSDADSDADSGDDSEPDGKKSSGTSSTKNRKESSSKDGSSSGGAGRTGSLLGSLANPTALAGRGDLPAPAGVDELVGKAGLPTGKAGLPTGKAGLPTGKAGSGSGPTRVTLLEKNGSGISGSGTVDEDNVVATASGLDPNARYASFFYGATSSATNNNPCILDGTNPLPSGQTVGDWTVDDDGNGTLRTDNPLGSRYRLQAGTMSIRKVEHDFSDATAVPVNPLSYSLVACGEVERLAALDPVTNAAPKLPTLPSVPPLS